MIDPQTGYDDAPACFCKPCSKCDGEGRIPSLIYYHEGDDAGPNCATFTVLETERCPQCHGSGNDSSDCEVEAHWQEVAA